MNRLFRNGAPGASDYAALAVFVAVYLATIAVIVAPDGTFATSPGVAHVSSNP